MGHVPRMTGTAKLQSVAAPSRRRRNMPFGAKAEYRMTGRCQARASKIVIALGVAIMLMAGLVGCDTAGSVGRAGAFPDVDQMEAELKKGVSTKADVERLLGPPSGRGGALSALEPLRPRELWTYSEFGWSLIEYQEGGARVHLDQQLLMVFFVDDRLDGFWWHSNAGPLKLRPEQPAE